MFDITVSRPRASETRSNQYYLLQGVRKQYIILLSDQHYVIELLLEMIWFAEGLHLLGALDFFDLQILFVYLDVGA